MAEATIRDVARRADVSVASVSRTLNSPATVQQATRERVLAAVAELRYVPHAGARSLSTRLSNAIGVVLPDLHGEFFSELVRGMDREASAAGYQLFLSTTHADATLAGQAMRAMRGRVDGLVVMAPQFDRDQVDAILPAALPTVLINSSAGGTRHGLRIDNRHGVLELMGHLIGSGRRHIVHIAGPEGNIDSFERAAAYREALTAAGLQSRILAGDFSEEAGAAAVARLLHSNIAFDALFAANDMMALGAMVALREAGRAIPADIALAGFDDVPLARYLGLTTVQVRMDMVGARAIARLVAELRGEAGEPSVELIRPTLVVRATTGEPA